MIRRVDPLLWLGLGLCAASGCALSAPSRTGSVETRMSRLDERSMAATRAVRGNASRGPESRGIVSFRTPQRQESSLHESPLDERASQGGPVIAASPSRRDEGRETLLFGGHSSDQQTGEIEGGASSLVTQAVAWTEEQRPDQDSGSGLRTANYRSDQDASDNPIELQGFEAIAPSASEHAKSGFSESRTSQDNEPPPWSSRPSAGSSVQFSPPIEYGGLLPSRHASNTPVGFHSLPPAEVFSTPTGDTHGPAPRGAARRVQPVSSQVAPPLPPSPWQSEVNQLIARVEGELKDMSPGSSVAAQAEYRRRQVHLRLLYLVAQRPEQALTAISGLEAAEQEYWQQLCWAASNSLDAEQFPLLRDRATQSIAPLNTALRRLREQADLSIKNTAFCEQISYFGNYQKFARDEFTPGQEVLLYAEIENFNTEQTTDGEHRTLLRSVIDIIGANGQTRWHKTFAATEDRCRNPRRDYFHNYQFAIPDRLPLGPHTLKLTVVDDLSGKQASYSLRFLVK